MLRRVLGVVAGFLAFIIIVTAGNRVLRLVWPDYAAVEKAMTFSLAMLLARLALSFAATVMSGWVAAVVGKKAQSAWLLGILWLVIFAPLHLLALWTKFPIWYHLVFLASLLPLSVWGAEWSGTAAERKFLAGGSET